MKNKFFILFLFISYLSFSQSYGLMTTDVNSRKQASVKSKQLRVIKKGQLVEILKTKGAWSFVKDISVNKKGWVSKKYILKDVAILKTDANSRKSPNGSILRVIKKGQKVEILQTKKGWVFVRDIRANKKGWVANSVLSTNSILPTSSEPQISTTYTTQPKNKPPNCDCEITSPSNGDKNVNIKPTVIRWKAASGSPKPAGYYFSIASIVDGEETYVEDKVNDVILRSVNIGNVTSFSTQDLKPNTKYYIGLVPYNNIGLADCKGLFSFTTGNGTNTNNIASSEQIIERRLNSMGILWKWTNFNKTKLRRISMTNNQREFFIDEVLSWRDVPYKYGGTNRNGIDCSGLIWRGLRQAIDYNGEKLNAQGWAQSGKLIANKNSLIPGDLVCFSNIPGGSNRLVQHIAIYIGNGKFWHAPSSGKRVSIAELDNSFWKPKFIFGVRY